MVTRKVKVKVKVVKKRKKSSRKHIRTTLPHLSLIAQDGRPLKLVLDSDQTFSVLSNGQKHDVTISYTILDKDKVDKTKKIT